MVLGKFHISTIFNLEVSEGFQCQAGASSVRLSLVPGRHPRPDTARSSGDGEIATPSCSTLAIRAGNRLGFLAAIGALIASPEGTSMEVQLMCWSDDAGRSCESRWFCVMMVRDGGFLNYQGTLRKSSILIYFDRVFHYKPSSYWGTTILGTILLVPSKCGLLG